MSDAVEPAWNVGSGILRDAEAHSEALLRVLGLFFEFIHKLFTGSLSLARRGA